MKKNTENFMMILLPVTLVAAIVVTIIAAVAFNMDSTAAHFTFTSLAVVFWIGLIVEFFLLYEAVSPGKTVEGRKPDDYIGGMDGGGLAV